MRVSPPTPAPTSPSEVPQVVRLCSIPAGATTPTTINPNTLQCISTPLAGPPCYSTLEGGPTASATTVGEVHIPGASNGSFSYSQGSSSDIGVGFSSGSGPWSTKGSVHMTKTESTENGWNNLGAGFANQLQEFFTYGKYHVQGYSCDEHLIKAEQWTTGLQIGVGVGQWDGYCTTTYSNWQATYPNGTFLKKVSGKGFHYAIGATIFGVDLDVESEWNTQTSFNINFGQDTIECGNDNTINAASLVYHQ